MADVTVSRRPVKGERPTWRPDIRAAVIRKARVNMHRKGSNAQDLIAVHGVG